ncbi:uncharacterized protein TNCV_256721 [Trichonephila clavipes]|nr:uncharacterized protein TNCV_256721 [Trichonephila clavipes]
MRCIDQGLESLKTFCAVMSLPNAIEQKSYDVINNKLSCATEEVAEESIKRAVVEENSSSPDNLLTVSGDGTWKTRGHSSLIGVWPVIGAETGDGDTKTFNALSENKPYGDDHLIQKVECVGHVQKRMGTRLRKLKLVYSKKKLSDGKTIGGKGRFTDSLIDKLAIMKFGLKINRNVCVSLAERDNHRIFTSRQRRLASCFEARRAKKIKKSKEIELFQEQEGISYDPGAF